MRRALPPVILLLGFFATIGAAAPNASPEGYWLTAKHDAVVEILRCGESGTLCGRLVWFRIDANDPLQPLDRKNPDPARRDQPLCGLVFIHGFKPAGPNDWEGGTIYDAETGNTYHATIKLRADGTLDLHGYIGISLIGRSEIWTRYAEKPPSCPTR